MMRPLLSTRSGNQVGSVTLADDGSAAFEGSAREVLTALRTDLGDAPAARLLMDEGWSNGWLYLGDRQG